MGGTRDMMNDKDYLQPAYRQNLSVPPTRAQIMALEAATMGLPDEVRLEPEDFPTFHHFSDGVYVREMHITAGQFVVGKIHRHNHIVMLIKGTAKVVSEFGNEIIKGHSIWESKAGTKRAVLAITDCVFYTVHVTDETDLDKIEDYVIAPTYEALEADL